MIKKDEHNNNISIKEELEVAKLNKKIIEKSTKK